MSTRRTLRQRISISLIGVMLLMQWLVLAHACAPAAAAPARVAVGGAHAGCAEHVPSAVAEEAEEADTADLGGSAALCKAHCAGEQSLPAAQADGSPQAPSLGWFFLAPQVAPATWLPAPAAHGLPPSGGAPPGWPPLYISQRVLRN